VGLLDRVSVAEQDTDFPDEFETEFQDDFNDGYEQDPAPMEVPDRVPRSRAALARIRPTQAPVSARTRKRISAELQVWGEILAMPLQARDPICGEVVAQQMEPVCDRISAILGRYPDLAAKFLGSTVAADVVGLLAALKPIAMVVTAHHITHTIGDNGDDAQLDLDQYPAYQPIH